MNTQAFWNVIGNYNTQTWLWQVVLLLFLAVAIGLSYRKQTCWPAKAALGIANLFIGIVFFACYGTEPIQKYFALPLFLLVGILFLYESWHSKDAILRKPNTVQMFLLLLYLFYPVVSLLAGNTFPQMVTYIMPCPLVSLSIAVYAGYERKNILLLALLTLWGVTGIKAVFVHAYEDLILLICGLYGVVLLTNAIKHKQ